MAELTKEEILTIARNHCASELTLTIEDAKDCFLRIYGVDTSNAWCVYVTRPYSPMGLYSSEVVLISKTTGKVLYSGSANDEG